MTIAQQNTSASLPTTIHGSESVDIARLWKLVRLDANGFWLHTKAYTTILGVMLLTLISLIFLSIHWYYRRLFPFIGTDHKDKQLKIKS
ncbi:hypothetical protein H6G97_10350 [Nostoc flagelliforme FACHB-838]|uniref:Uncharacterized protein n=1 Tax=Nostoc flagelliforme FACHB-838 TaxID=2692904 RepID=A0ABR8DLY6_9NOSO|nr:hypothetical protein [Nostoc flagelliforme]MBD2529946.1 hypothetical protein [Nostoc flagelliforme FACHB-838]